MGGEEADVGHRPLYGLGDRGTLEPGMLADINVIDYEHLQLGTPRVHATCPPAVAACVQGAIGYVATIKSGTATFENGEDTGERPGVLLRGSR